MRHEKLRKALDDARDAGYVVYRTRGFAGIKTKVEIFGPGIDGEFTKMFEREYTTGNASAQADFIQKSIASLRKGPRMATGYIRHSKFPNGSIIPIFLEMEYGMYYVWSHKSQEWHITNALSLSCYGVKLIGSAYKAKVDERLLCSGITFDPQASVVTGLI
ncbi:hypothetical protein CPT_Solomon_056 [Klebsiella phage Solomon]|uniref:Uncharacterized protein n=1 Tax=Klebsiella phage Solomon TaxID=2767583 RepID=A0A873WVF4_9CAUD|nr:hypothetical protein CPT_Solomon_056 [Klebsiella phage Solomon]